WAKEPAAPLGPRALSYAAHLTPSAELRGVFADSAAQLSARVTRRRTAQRSAQQATESNPPSGGAAATAQGLTPRSRVRRATGSCVRPRAPVRTTPAGSAECPPPAQQLVLAKASWSPAPPASGQGAG